MGVKRPMREASGRDRSTAMLDELILAAPSSPRIGAQAITSTRRCPPRPPSGGWGRVSGADAGQILRAP